MNQCQGCKYWTRHVDSYTLGTCRHVTNKASEVTPYVEGDRLITPEEFSCSLWTSR